MMRLRSLRIDVRGGLLPALLLLLTIAPATAPAAHPAAESSRTAADYTALVEDYVIGEGDTLQVSVWGSPEFDIAPKVRPDGKITIPAVGDVVAMGLTPAELKGILTEKLRHLVKNPVVTVAVREITNSKVYIFGGGVQSRVYNLDRRTTLLQLLCMVGTPAGESRVAGAAASVPDYRRAYLLRGGKKVKENFQELFVNGKVDEDLVVQPNDALFIPDAAEKNVYIVGAVNLPRVVQYHEGMTVMQAILEGGGFGKFARENDTMIVRREGGKEVTIPVKAAKIKDGDLSQNRTLQPGDFVIVPEGMF